MDRARGRELGMDSERKLRESLAKILDWKDAHVGFDAAVEGIPKEKRGTAPDGIPFSPWQLLEHMRLAQQDILEFCTNSEYRERSWPKDYWPPSATPPSAPAWEKSIASYREGRAALQKLALDPAVDLHARIPHGTGQTYLREILLVADHNAYHVGQLVLVRRGLGIWPSG